MGFSISGQASDGSDIYAIDQFGQTELYIGEDGDLELLVGAGWLGLLTAGGGSNTLDIQSFMETALLGGGNDEIDITGDGYVKFADTGDGKDRVTLIGEEAGIRALATKNGSDRVEVSFDARIDFVDTGDGIDRIFVTDFGDIDFVDTGDGNDRITLETESDIDALKSGEGADNILVDTRSSLRLAETGEGADTVTVDNDSDIGSIETGRGGDKIFVKKGSFIDSLITGEGNDSVEVRSDSRIRYLDMDDGNESLLVSGESVVESLRMDDGASDIVVKNGRIDQMQVGGEDGVTLTLSKDARVGSAQLNDGDDTIVLEDSSRIYLLKMGRGNNWLTTGEGNVESVYSYEGNNTLNFGSGGAQQVALTGDGVSHEVSSEGFISSLHVTGNSTIDVTLGERGAGTLQIFTNKGSDVATGTGFVNSIKFWEGNDEVTTGTGGVGTIRTSNGSDKVTINGFAEFLSAGRGKDDVVVNDYLEFARLNDGNDTYVGGSQVDTVNGGKGADDIQGNSGSDVIRGGNGKDTINGGQDNDVLFGNSGDDVFVFESDAGDDVVMDFQVGDTLDFTALGLDLSDLNFSETNQGALIEYSEGSVTLTNVSQNEIEAADNFLF